MFEEATDQQLQEELERRKQESKIAELLRRQRLYDFVLQHKQFFLDNVVTHHSRTSCSDNNPNNNYANSFGHVRCTRCAIVTIETTDPPLFQLDITLGPPV